MVETYFIDGATKKQPEDSAGPSYAAYYHNNEKRTIFIGTQTINTAEYMGLIYALSHAVSMGYKELIIKTDSQLVIGQVAKGWRFTNSKHLEGLCEITKNLMDAFVTVQFEKIKSNDNLADLK